jgi:hypothetical protein
MLVLSSADVLMSRGVSSLRADHADCRRAASVARQAPGRSALLSPVLSISGRAREQQRMRTPDQIEQRGPSPAVRVMVPDQARPGVYANLALVSHSGHEFSLDLCQVQHGAEGDEVRADVVSRVHLPPTMVRSLIRTLQANLDAYEGRFGAVRHVEPGA